MSRLPPGQAPARDRHGYATPELGFGWCLPCYDAGAFTLALDSSAVCAIHGRSPTDCGVPGEPQRSGRLGSRPPRGRAGRDPRLDTRPPSLPRSSRCTLDRSAARAKAYGRRRAARRVEAGHYLPHPGWRNFIDTGWRVLVDQAEAMRVVEALVDDEEWRADKRSSWLQILRQLVYCMDWSTGLIAAVTADKLGDAGGRAPRTVSRVMAWARDIGLVVVVEHGASAEFLGTERGRTPTYALVSSSPAPTPPSEPLSCPDASTMNLFDKLVDESGDLSASAISSKPLLEKRLQDRQPATGAWPIYAIPDSPPARSAASRSFLKRLGLDERGVSQIPLWRTRALLRPWWAEGACVAGLLFALERHPNSPEHRRGDVLRGARDPLSVIGARLRPWKGRLSELPATLVGIHGDYRQPILGTDTPETVAPPAARDARNAARQALDAHLRLLRQGRGY